MKVLMINGSPHQHGCTDAALSQVAQALMENGVESEIFWLGKGPFYSCTACGGCAKTGRCVFDDPVNALLDRAEAAQGLVIGSPVHYASASGAVTAVMDRFFYAAKGMGGKVGAAVASARRAGTTATLDQLNKYFYISGMPIVPSQYWPMVHGASAEEARQDLEGMQIMRTLGRNMAWLLQCMQAGKAAQIYPPEPETPRQRTNFIR